jgi:hypothetical protein
MKFFCNDLPDEGKVLVEREETWTPGSTHIGQFVEPFIVGILPLPQINEVMQRKIQMLQGSRDIRNVVLASPTTITF